MNSWIVELDWRKVIKRSRPYFEKASGMSIYNPAHQLLLDEAERVLEENKADLDIKAILCCFRKWPAAGVVEERFDLHGEELSLAKWDLHCKAFGKMELQKIRRVYAYFVRVKPFKTVGEKAVDQLFANTWENALTDGARELLTEEIQKHARKDGIKESQISHSFGPGFFGMELSEMRKLFQITDAARIGVTLNYEGVMDPPKSCAGLHFLGEPGMAFPEPDCSDCLGNRQNCGYCRIGTKRKDSAGQQK